MVRLRWAGRAVRGGSGAPGSFALRRPSRRQPWPMAWPFWSVTVTQAVVWGLAAASAARARHSAGSSGPKPWLSPGRPLGPRRAARGMVRSIGLGGAGDAGDADQGDEPAVTVVSAVSAATIAVVAAGMVANAAVANAAVAASAAVTRAGR